jgi:hypothetical protein
MTRDIRIGFANSVGNTPLNHQFNRQNPDNPIPLLLVKDHYGDDLAHLDIKSDVSAP